MNRLTDFGGCLKNLLLENGITIKELSDITGIKQSRNYDYINAKHYPSIDNTVKIAAAFKCSLDSLFGFSNDYTISDYTVSDAICVRIKKAVDESRLTRFQIHKMTGISEPQLLRWYHGIQVPTLASLVTLVEVLDCSLDYLIGRD